MTMTKDEALRMALEALEIGKPMFDAYWGGSQFDQAITAIKEALAQEKALQALHDENERLGLYKGVYEEEPQHPVHIGVDVTKEGTTVTAFYRKPNSVMEMFYSQFHPLAQLEQEPVAWMHRNEFNEYRLEPTDNFKITDLPIGVEMMLYTTLPQRTAEQSSRTLAWVGLTDEQIEEVLGGFPYYSNEWEEGEHKRFARAIEAAHGIIKEKTHDR